MNTLHPTLLTGSEATPPPIGPLEVLIVDDHPLVRAGLAAILRSDARFVVAGEAASGREAIEVCRGRAPHLVILDIRMPGSSGLEACRWIKASIPETKVVFLTSYGDDECLLNAISAGADGYILKSIQGFDLVGTLLKVWSGGACADPIVTQRLFAHLANQQRPVAVSSEPGAVTAPSARSTAVSLTLLESRVMDLVAQGRLNKEIAAEMGVAEKTVRNQLTRIFGKLHVVNRTEASVVWQQHRHTLAPAPSDAATARPQPGAS